MLWTASLTKQQSHTAIMVERRKVLHCSYKASLAAMMALNKTIKRECEVPMSDIKMIAPAVKNVPWQEKPEGIKGAPIWRYSENPIIGRNPVEGVARIFNSAVMPYGNEFIGVFRENRPTAFPISIWGEAKTPFTGTLRRIRFPSWMKRAILSCPIMPMTPGW